MGEVRSHGGIDPDPVTYAEQGDRSAPANLPDDALWPILAAIVTVMVLSLLRPSELLLVPSWVVPACELVLIVAIVANRPRRLSRRAGLLRGLAVGLVVALVGDALVATGRLVVVLIEGGRATNSAEELLTSARAL